MIYDGKKAAKILQEHLKERVASIPNKPTVAIISVASHPSITSFITIKRKFGEAIGVVLEEYTYDEAFGEDALITKIQSLTLENKYVGIIVQLPLPPSYNTKRVLDAIPEELDVDVLGSTAFEKYTHNHTPIPPVAGAVAHILHDTNTELNTQNVVIIGQGKLVGLPVALWFKQKNIIPNIIDITTEEDLRMKLLKEADIVVTGTGTPHLLQPEYFKDGVVLIDAGTSEQSGVLSGDCDPLCETIASVITPVPGGVGPLTVACLFENIVQNAENMNR